MSDHDSGVDSDDEATQNLLDHHGEAVIIIPQPQPQPQLAPAPTAHVNGDDDDDVVDDDYLVAHEDIVLEEEDRPEWAQARRLPDFDDDDDEDDEPREYRPMRSKMDGQVSCSLASEAEMRPTTSTAPYPTCSNALQMRTVSITEMDAENDADGNDDTSNTSSDDDALHVPQAHPSHTHSHSQTSAQVNLQGCQFELNNTELNSLWSFYQSSRSNSGCDSTSTSVPSTSTSTSSSFQPPQHDFIGKMKNDRRRRKRCASMGARWNLDSHPYDFLAEKQLRIACNSNDIQTVRRLLSMGTTANASDERRRTPLHLAACHGYCNIAMALLQHGADPNLQDVVGNTPLHLAVCASKLDMVIVLLQAGASCTSSDNSGRTPLRLARSKLSLIARSMQDNPTASESLEQFKLEAMKISLMLSIYFEKCKRDQGRHEAEARQIGQRLQRSQTTGEVERDVNDLLNKLQQWSL